MSALARLPPSTELHRCSRSSAASRNPTTRARGVRARRGRGRRGGAAPRFVARRIERRYVSHLRSRADGCAAAFDGTSAVVVEEIWRLVGREATAAWLVKLAKRARHIGLWLIAITQQRSDLATPDGRALLDDTTIQLFLRNGADDVAHVAEALHLSAEEVAQITRLVTEKHSHAEAYIVIGERGRRGVTIRHGNRAYWLAASDPVVDVPWRELVLEDAGAADARDEQELPRAAFAAVDLVADLTCQQSPQRLTIGACR